MTDLLAQVRASAFAEGAASREAEFIDALTDESRKLHLAGCENDRLQAAADLARAEYERHWTATPDESLADLVRSCAEEVDAERERFKARGAEIDRLEAALAISDEEAFLVAAEAFGSDALTTSEQLIVRAVLAEVRRRAAGGEK